MRGKIGLAEKIQMRGKNQIRGNQNWQDFEHVEKLDLILTYIFGCFLTPAFEVKTV
jgi:hypothetical protein